MSHSAASEFTLLAALLRSTPRAQVIAKSIEAEGLLRHSLEKNSAAKGPYHNGVHGQEVARIAYGLSEMVKNPKAVSKALFVAGLFHDFNHSLGKTTDAENIQRAQHGFLEAIGENRAELPSRLGRFIVLEAIASTQYPYEPLDASFLEPCAILRDADRLQILTLNWRSQLIGLGVEMGVSGEELIPRSQAFHKALLSSLESQAARAFKTELAALFELRHQALKTSLAARTQP